MYVCVSFSLVSFSFSTPSLSRVVIAHSLRTVENDYAPAMSIARSPLGWGKLSDTFLISPYEQLTTQSEASVLAVREAVINPLRLAVMGQLLQPEESVDLRRMDAWISMNGEPEPKWEYVFGCTRSL